MGWRKGQAWRAWRGRWEGKRKRERKRGSSGKNEREMWMNGRVDRREGRKGGGSKGRGVTREMGNGKEVGIQSRIEEGNEEDMGGNKRGMGKLENERKRKFEKGSKGKCKGSVEEK